jgi:HAE1 family hydrophobic/amphiphilic exporter-1
MNLSEPFIRKPVMTTLAALSALAFGISAYLSLPTSDLPDVAYPVITVTTSYPGASPEIMANNVATPLELQMMQIQGLDLITSSNMEGFSSIILQFGLNKSLESAATDVEAAIQRAMGNLPTDLPAPPSFTLTNPNDLPIIYIALSTDTMSVGDLYDYGNNIVAQRMSMLEGVSQAEVYGSPRAVRVKVNPNALASRNVTLTDVANAVTDANVFVPGGQLVGAATQYTIDPNGQLLFANDYEDVIVRYEKGGPVRIRDVGRAQDALQSEYLNLTFWSSVLPQRAASVIVAITAAPGSNAVQVAEEVSKTLDALKRTLPGSIDTAIVYKRSTQIIDSINDVKFTILLAFALVLLVIFLFLGRLNETIIPSIALPMSLVLTLIVMKALNFSLDNLSLMALTLAVGFLVDDAIVVLENTVRHLESGKSPVEAALRGAKELSWTVFSMTVSLAAGVMPLVVMPGLMGRMFHEFAVTIVVAIVTSGVVAITLSPMMCSRLLKRHDKSDQTRVEQATNAVFARLHGGYGRALRWVLRHKWIAVVSWLVCLVGSILLFTGIPKTFLPIGDSGTVRGVFVAQEGTSALEMQEYQRRIIDEVKGVSGVEEIVTVTNIQYGALSPSMGILWAKLKPEGERPPIDEVSEMINGAIYKNVPGALPLIRPVPTLQIDTGATANQQGEYAYTLTSTDPSLLYDATEKLIERMNKLPGFSQVSSDMRHNTPFLNIEILRDQAYTFGVSANSIEQTLQLAYSGGRIAQIMTPLNQYDLIVELEDEFRRYPAQLEMLRLRGESAANSNSSSLVPLASVARWNITPGPESINHINQITSTTIFYNLIPGYPVGEGARALDAAASEVLPLGVTGAAAGEAQQFEKTIGSMVLMLVIAVFVIYVILGILYESYIHPITILSTLPTAAVGGLLTLALLGMDLSLYAYIGIFLLIGIVKKNGIMVVDFAIQRLREGRSLEDAVVEACEERMRPILMTTFAAIFGAIPIALGLGADGASRQPLGLCIVGGLLVSQVLTLFVTPVFYLYMERFQEKVLDKISFFQRGEPAASVPT